MAASLLSSSSFIFLISSLIHLANAEGPRTDIVARQCRKVHAKNMSNYIESYHKILSLMQDEMHRNKFAFKEAGEAPDRMYVMAQCMDDLSSDECEKCFNHINALLPGCFPKTGGRVYLDGCFIRAENYSFFHETVMPDYTKTCSSTIDDRPQYRVTAMEVITKLVQKALGRGFAEQHKESYDVAVYGMAKCWKTLDADLCAQCLKNASKSAISCLPSAEGHVLNSGCFLRYSNYEFANNSKNNRVEDDVLLFVSYIIGSVAICTMAVAIGFFVGMVTYERQQKRQKKSYGMKMGSSIYRRSMQFLHFKYSTLEKATENFNQAHKLGQGGFGEVFKGTLPDGREFAVKRLFISGKGRGEEVYNEMDIISRAQHKNLVRFLGCCFVDVNSFLVYEYLPNRSLDRILFDPEKKKELSWKKRLGIILGTAEGLEYLHKDCQIRIVHRDIKASNILLDLKHKPKIADFGLARFYSCDQNLISTAIAGTLGYMAPEYLAQGRLTEKVDVYSYGVLVLEIVSGVQNNKFQPEESLATLVTTAWKRFQANTVSVIIDSTMEIEDREEITRVIQVGLLCTQESPSLRPTMTTILQMLRHKDVELPIPSKPAFVDESMEVSFQSGSSRRPSIEVTYQLGSSQRASIEVSFQLGSSRRTSIMSDLCISQNSDSKYR